MTFYVPKYFEWHELVPSGKYKDYWLLLLDSRVLITIDRLRTRYGKMEINNWYWGGKNRYSGWRPNGCPVGASLSQHKFGRAADLKPQEVTAAEIKQDIITMGVGNLAFEYITAIEMEVDWLHFDVRNCNTENGVLKLYP